MNIKLTAVYLASVLSPWWLLYILGFAEEVVLLCFGLIHLESSIVVCISLDGSEDFVRACRQVREFVVTVFVNGSIFVGYRQNNND